MSSNNPQDNIIIDTPEEKPIAPAAPPVEQKPVEHDTGEYLYNKSTIGGIDTSKLEYKETFKNKVYLSKPSNLYSWIALGILLIIATGFGLIYYVYPDILNFGQETDIPVIDVNDSDIANTNEPNPSEPTYKERLLIISTPSTLANDEVLINIANISEDISGNSVTPLLTTSTLERFTAEFNQVKTLVEENTTPADVEATRSE